MLAEPLKSLGKKGKTLQISRNFLKRKKARKSKKARKRRLGFWSVLVQYTFRQYRGHSLEVAIRIGDSESIFHDIP